jgi:ParB family transcriptional regulator, chromosome partitioning protein
MFLLKDKLRKHSLLTQMKYAVDKSGHNVMPTEITVVEQVLASLGRMAWESYVKNRLPLLNLPKELLSALKQGSIEYTKVRASRGLRMIALTQYRE